MSEVEPDKPMSKCDCAIQLDKLRMAHEAGELESFMCLAVTKDGKDIAFTHDTDVGILTHYGQLILGFINQIEEEDIGR